MSKDSATRQDFEKWLLDTHGLKSKWNPERNCFEDYAAHLAYQAWRTSAEQYGKDAERYRWLLNRMQCKKAASAAGSIRPALFIRIGGSFFDCDPPTGEHWKKNQEETQNRIDAAIEAGKARES